MAVDITLGPKLNAGVPQRLFAAGSLNTVISSSPVRHQWAVTPNGQRFLARIPAAQGQIRGGVVTVPAIPFAVTGGQNRTGQPPTAPASGQGFVSSGLTVIRDWPVALKKEVP